MQRVIVLIICLLCAAFAKCQECVSLPSVAAVDSSVLRMPAGISPQTDRFFSKLDSVVLFGTGRVNILHIGGSHVQADIYTNVIRQNLDSLNGTLRPSRGLIFPYSVARTNNPSNYRVRYGGEWHGARNALRQFDPDQGLSGILVSTTDTAAWIGIALNAANDSLRRWDATQIHILGRAENGTCRPLLLVDSVVVEPTIEPTGFAFQLPKPTDSFVVKLQYDSVPDRFVLTGILLDNDDSGIVYSSVGVNGASVPSYLGCADFARDLSLLRPDMVVFALGINDATAHNFTDSLFCANYDSLICRIRSVVPDCALLFITNNDSYKRVRRRYIVNTNGEIAQRAFYALAHKWQAALWDLYAVMGGQKSMAEWEKAGLASRDKVHFKRAGYEIIGKLFFDALLNYYLEYDCKYDF